MTGRALGLFVIPLVCGIATAAAQQPAMVNLGFEESAVRGGRAVPAGWASGGEGFEVGLDSSTRVEGRWSLVSRRTAREAWGPGAGFGVASQFPRVGAAAGRAVRLSGWIRTEGVTTGYAGLWARADGPGNRVLSFDNMGTRGVSGTTAWARYEITIPVDSAATGLALGVLHPGDGTAWFDSLRLEVVGPPRPRQPLPPGVPSFEPPPRPDEPKSRLLTDDELRIPAADVDSHEAAQVMDWVRTAAHPIRSLSATTFDDLRFLAPLLRGKRILQLGESGHGVREFNLAKVRLIQYLHEEL
ncbi:MAG TPA: hypothetical protein VEA99_12605, partial [Gemmatimonadaceae bacterium]|nr:hypothetical protein [Gemmatimonadaceae bacterium]